MKSADTPKNANAESQGDYIKDWRQRPRWPRDEAEVRRVLEQHPYLVDTLNALVERAHQCSDINDRRENLFAGHPFPVSDLRNLGFDIQTLWFTNWSNGKPRNHGVYALTDDRSAIRNLLADIDLTGTTPPASAPQPRARLVITDCGNVLTATYHLHDSYTLTYKCDVAPKGETVPLRETWRPSRPSAKQMEAMAFDVSAFRESFLCDVERAANSAGLGIQVWIQWEGSHE